MGNAGYFNFALQSAKGTANTADGQQIFCTDTNFAPTDIVKARRPHIGGRAFSSGIYKAGTGVAGQIGLEVTGEHIGYLLYFLSGAVDKTADTPVAGLAENSFTMATDEFALPWVTFKESKDDVLITQGTDGNVVGGRFVWTAGDSLTAMFTLTGITPSFGADPTTPVLDESDVMICSTSDAVLEIGDVAFDAQQVIVDLVNVVPGLPTEMKIGSPFRKDITKLARACTVTMRSWVDAAFWKEVYFGGSTTWSTAPYQEKFEISGATGNDIPTYAYPYSLKFTAGEVGFGPCNAPTTAQQITMVQTNGSVTIPDSGDEFEFLLTTIGTLDFTTVPS